MLFRKQKSTDGPRRSAESLEPRLMLASDLKLFDVNDGGFPYFDPVGIVNNTLYYEDTDAAFGAELHQIDLMTEAASLVADINPGLGDSYAGNYGGAVVGDKLYFSAYDPERGKELRILDTQSGAVETIDIVPGPSSSSPGEYSGFTAIGAKLYFFATSSLARELHVFDTIDHTLTSFDTPSFFSNRTSPLSIAGGKLYFASENSSVGAELHAFHPTDGTFQTFDIYPGPNSSSPTDLIVVGSRLYFTARDPNLGEEPMVIDSTDDSISTLDVNPGSNSSFAEGYFLIGSKLYFQALEPSVGYELQILDTTDNSLQTVDVNELPGHSSSPREFAAVGSQLYFAASEGSRYRLKTYDTVSGDLMTVAPADGGPVAEDVYAVKAVGSQVYFSGTDAAHGDKLRVVDATQNTYSTIDLQLGPVSIFADPQDRMLTVGDSLVFVANVTSSERSLVALDTNDNSWLPVEDVHDGHRSSYAGRYGGYATVGNKVYFVAETDMSGRTLHFVDLMGDSVTAIPNLDDLTFGPDTHFEVIGSKIYFNAIRADYGSELHILDTTDNSLTTLDLVTGPSSSLAGEFGFARIADKLYFTAFDETYGSELRELDTTDQSFETVDINPGDASSNAGRYNGYVVSGGKLIFVAFDPTYGYEMRILDAGDLSWSTVDLDPGTSGGSIWWGMTAVADKIAFAASDANGIEYRVLDLDDESFLTFDINQGPNSSDAGEFGGFVTIGSKVYFSARGTDNVLQLWEYESLDDTLRSIPDTTTAGSTAGFAVVGPNLIFSAYNDLLQQRLHVLNSINGAISIVDVRPGAIGDDLGDFFTVGPRVYFAGNPLTPTGSELIEFDVSDKTFESFDILSGNDSSEPGFYGGFGRLGSTVLFSARKTGFGVELFALDALPSGDFNRDGNWDGPDIDWLTAVIANGTYDAAFDLTGDGLIDVSDRDEWLREAGGVNLGRPYLLGDANLDGFVDGQDYIAWNRNKFSASSTWTDGDFNADGVIDGRDFLIWNANKFQPSAPFIAVAEIRAVVSFTDSIASGKGIRAPAEIIGGSVERLLESKVPRMLTLRNRTDLDVDPGRNLLFGSFQHRAKRQAPRLDDLQAFEINEAGLDEFFADYL